MAETPLTDEENAAALAVWHALPAEHRAFVVALQEAELISGRRALANARVAIYPETLPPTGGVVPCIETEADRAALAAIRKRGAKS